MLLTGVHVACHAASLHPTPQVRGWTNTRARGIGTRFASHQPQNMRRREMDQTPHPRGLEPDELAAEEASELPDREAMSLLDLNLDLGLDADIAAPINAA